MDLVMRWRGEGGFGGAERDRTAGLLVANEALSQLSYSPTNDSSILPAKAVREKTGNGSNGRISGWPEPGWNSFGW
jgi:hypothetical protein